MKHRFWLKLSAILLTGMLLVCFALAWWFSLYQPRIFWSYFEWTLCFAILSFVFLFLAVFLYLRPLVRAMDFLSHLFGTQQGQRGRQAQQRQQGQRGRQGPAITESECKKALAFITNTKNFYIKDMAPALGALLQKEPGPAGNGAQRRLCFSDIVRGVQHRARKLYPDLSLRSQLKSDIPLPVFADTLFQALWELVKNGAQALSLPDKQKKQELMIRTFKKSNTWFCCEVEDTGPGMSREEMERASKLYFTTKKHSTGLGLCFVQSALTRMGGIMKLQSPKGGGLRVCMFIPLDYINHIQRLTRRENARATSHSV